MIKQLLFHSNCCFNTAQNLRAILRLAELCIREFLFLKRVAGCIDILSNKESLKTQILLQAHCIEKGLSLRTPRKGFGIPLIQELLRYMTIYYNKFNDIAFLVDKCAILDAYIEFHKDDLSQIATVIVQYQKFLDLLNMDSPQIVKSIGGVYSFSNTENQRSRTKDFKEFAQSRHSMRYFDNHNVDIAGAVKKALSLAQCAPSACNRQPQQVYIFRGKAKEQLLQYQRGSNAFLTEVDTLLLVTACQSRYCFDIHQSYIDGGLYAMNLLYSLHYYGLGTIPLSTALITSSERRSMTRDWGIAENEVLILLIAVGGMPEKCRSNLSARKAVEQTVRIIE